MNANTVSKMSPIERETIKDMVKGMSEDEQRLVSMFIKLPILQNELDRRTTMTLDMMRELFEILDSVTEDMDTATLIGILKDCRRALKTE